MEPIWVVNTEVDPQDGILRLLGRLGPVVDVAGLDLDESAARLGAESPQGIVSFVDDTIEFAAALAERLGLRYHTPEVAATVVDKGRQRAVFERAGIPSPRFRQLPGLLDRAQLDATVAGLAFPAVLKPLQSSGSRGVLLVSDVEELHAAMTEPGEGMGWIVEEFIPDPESDGAWHAHFVSVESVVSGGQISSAAVTGRFPLVPPFRESGNFIPAVVDPTALADILELSSEAIRALGIVDSVVHTEIKLSPEGLRLIEVNGRLGGQVPFILESVSDVNLFNVTCQVASGIPVRFDGPVKCRGVGFWLLMQPPTWARRLTGVQGLAEVASRPGVTEVRMERSPGDEVDWRLGTSANVARIKGHVADHDELARLLSSIEREVQITYEGQDDCS